MKQIPVLHGQRNNAERGHRLLAYLFFLCAAFFSISLLFQFGLPQLFNVLSLFSLALGNYLIVAAIKRQETWAWVASTIMAALLILSGGVLFVGSGNKMPADDAGTAYAGFFEAVMALVEVVAGIYILLNSNWRQKSSPEGDKPDDDPNR